MQKVPKPLLPHPTSSHLSDPHFQCSVRHWNLFHCHSSSAGVTFSITAVIFCLVTYMQSPSHPSKTYLLHPSDPSAAAWTLCLSLILPPAQISFLLPHFQFTFPTWTMVIILCRVSISLDTGQLPDQMNPKEGRIQPVSLQHSVHIRALHSRLLMDISKMHEDKCKCKEGVDTTWERKMYS